MENKTLAKKEASDACRLEYISLFSYMWSAHPFRKVADRDDCPKQREMTARKFCIIQTMSIRDVGK
jgi:hypothetical protein